jgi:hypothetical protein
MIYLGMLSAIFKFFVLPRSRQAWEETDESQNVLVGEVTKILDSIQLLNNQLRKVKLVSTAAFRIRTGLNPDPDSGFLLL